MQQKYCIKQECLRKAQGAFLLAHKMGLLDDPSMEGLEARRQNHNENKKYSLPTYPDGSPCHPGPERSPGGDEL